MVGSQETRVINKPGVGFYQTWDTSLLPPKDRFSYFREGVCQAFLSFSPEEPKTRDLAARVEVARLPRGMISRIDVTPIRVLRTKSDLAKIPGEYLSLGLQIRGGLAGELTDRSYTNNTGEVSLVQANNIRSFEALSETSYSTTRVIFDRTVLDIASLNNFYLMEGPHLSTLKGCILLIDKRYGRAPYSEMSNLFDAALSLLTAALINDKEYLEDSCTDSRATSSGLLQVIRSFISEKISNPHLTTEVVAERFGISSRYVQKMFAQKGETFKSHVTRARLAKVSNDLFDPCMDHLKVSEIAYKWGFRDIGTFHRNFKSIFGDTPKQMRSESKSRVLLSKSKMSLLHRENGFDKESDN